MKTLLEDIRSRIGRLIEPRLKWNIEELNLIQEIDLKDNNLSITIHLIEDDPKKIDAFRNEAQAVLEDLPLEKKHIRIDKVNVSEESLRDVRGIFLVGSGKGGVGKSTVAVNIAAALKAKGFKTGILDADIYGPSVPLLLGTHAKPQVLDKEMLMPVTARGMKIISMGNLLPRKKAAVWRGQLVSGTILQFLRQVNWGKLDYLIVDLPPGTGDVQMTIANEIKPDGTIIVSTPQHVAREDVFRCIAMFEDLKIPITGLVENMVSLTCEHCGHEQPVFTGSREGWGKIPLLGSLPMDRSVWDSSEQGALCVEGGSNPAMAAVFDRIAEILIEKTGHKGRDL